jgi:hypothetical protein
MDNVILLVHANLVLPKKILFRPEMGDKRGIEFNKMGTLANIQTYNFHII